MIFYPLWKKSISAEVVNQMPNFVHLSTIYMWGKQSHCLAIVGSIVTITCVRDTFQ